LRNTVLSLNLGLASLGDIPSLHQRKEEKRQKSKGGTDKRNGTYSARKDSNRVGPGGIKQRYRVTAGFTYLIEVTLVVEGAKKS